MFQLHDTVGVIRRNIPGPNMPTRSTGPSATPYTRTAAGHEGLNGHQIVDDQRDPRLPAATLRNLRVLSTDEPSPRPRRTCRRTRTQPGPRPVVRPRPASPSAPAAATASTRSRRRRRTSWPPPRRSWLDSTDRLEAQPTARDVPLEDRASPEPARSREGHQGRRPPRGRRPRAARIDLAGMNPQREITTSIGHPRTRTPTVPSAGAETVASGPAGIAAGCECGELTKACLLGRRSKSGANHRAAVVTPQYVPSTRTCSSHAMKTALGSSRPRWCIALDTEEVTGSNPVSPTTNGLARGSRSSRQAVVVVETLRDQLSDYVLGPWKIRSMTVAPSSRTGRICLR